MTPAESLGALARAFVADVAAAVVALFVAVLIAGNVVSFLLWVVAP